jgi:general secretion pathway protein D
MSSVIFRGGAFSGLQDAVRVVVDEINNTLIVQSSAADFAYISETIKKLDVMPRQAIIDAKIFEVDLTDDMNWGVAATLQARTSDQHLTTAAIDAATGAVTANTFAFIGSSRELLMSLQALQAKTKVRVLEAPSVLALDGSEAHIVVGGEVAYPGGSFVSGVGGATTSVQYRDTGVQLLVVPKISASGTVTLQIAQEISTPGTGNSFGPSFNKTSVSTTLAVKDGETVAIAGLIRDSNSTSRSGIPFVSSIPLIGGLFGQSTRSAHRTEVLIMITPHVIRTPERFNEMTQELKDSLRHASPFADRKFQEVADDVEAARQERARQNLNEQKQQKPEEQRPEQKKTPPPPDQPPSPDQPPPENPKG